ncbi:NAD-dependent epimerase/dehydratase family protein [Labedaea rhizosphaerae]|uniref:Nucleoside-diphosphate-sugar epimerase n=1 Tax=Labedaea rhizosphaerae TaxID=598644 RepID=A0A4V3CZR7_LABRH|nr:NAD-dependent epimerase/dehydratase family protein [Labedaea rhizosphaerae]TDQ00741.1 nucleoside-diphosphate-sugar epimerase [Labedaea rhizosphaerae]
MKIVVIGASGNVGTAVLDALHESGSGDDSVHAIARRRPEPLPPYAHTSWHEVDIADPRASGRLEEVFAGADVVVQLAWAIQPNHDRQALRDTNVDGSRRVFDALARAGVPHLVYVSSIGTYAPAVTSAPVDEQWPATGVRSSMYSTDKAAVETYLDEFERRHPATTVTRLRPALVMHRAAAEEIQRFFIGPVPRALFKVLRRGRLPMVPLPGALRMQVVHAVDLAAAVVAAIRTRLPGAVNIATDPVLSAEDLAQLVGKRLVPMPARLLRPIVHGAWRLRAVPVSPGWLDLAMRVPVMSTRRARTELGWEPKVTARAAVQDLLEGLAQGAGQPASPALRP